MAKFELKLPKMGESVAEATITSWLKEVGDTIEADEAVLEIATDKVDSEVPSEVDGVLVEKLFNVDDVVQVGQTIAVIETEGTIKAIASAPAQEIPEQKEEPKTAPEVIQVAETVVAAKAVAAPAVSSGDRFYSPLVRNIAKKEGVSQAELDAITGTGSEGRVTKNDILAYVENRGNQPIAPATPKLEPVQSNGAASVPTQAPEVKQVQPAISSVDDEIIEMSRMGKLVAKHMVDSVQTSAHVQSFIEADVTKIWNWRNKVKDAFQKREGENLTFTPIFIIQVFLYFFS